MNSPVLTVLSLKGGREAFKILAMDSTMIVAFLESPQGLFCDLAHLKGGFQKWQWARRGWREGKDSECAFTVQQCSPGLDGFWLAVHVSGNYIFLFFPLVG